MSDGLKASRLGQGSISTRRACGRPAVCRRRRVTALLPLLDAQGGGKTVGLKLTEDELGLYREWIENNRELERLVKEMRRTCALCRLRPPRLRLPGEVERVGRGLGRAAFRQNLSGRV